MDPEALETFVNSNKPNVFGLGDSPDSIESAVNAMVVCDETDDEAYPVLVLIRAGMPVAWADLENGHGFVPDHAGKR